MYEYDIKNDKYFNNQNEDYVLDSLTKVISRHYILDIAHKMIEEQTPFTLMILDIDNFKQINDNFGHLAGDSVLSSVGTNLLNICNKTAYIGRFGGDEFLLLVPYVTEYDDVHKFLEELCDRGPIFRRYYTFDNHDFYLTATVGTASFPKDAKSYTDLFNKADKALYRGKVKGRNCYIIYVESKHGDIVVKESALNSEVEKFKFVKRVLDINATPVEKSRHLINMLYTELHVSSAYFLFPDNKYVCNSHPEVRTTGGQFIPHLEILLNGDFIFYETPLTKFKNNDAIFGKYVDENKIQSIILAKVKLGHYHYGYIALCESTISRVWQENEVALILYAASCLELEFTDYDK